MDIPCTHTTCIKRYHFFFNAGNISLVFGDQFRFEFSIAVSGDIDLKFTILAFESFGGMPVSFIGGLNITFLIFLVTEGSIHFRFHKFLQNVFEAVFQQGIHICHAVNVIF